MFTRFIEHTRDNAGPRGLLCAGLIVCAMNGVLFNAALASPPALQIGAAEIDITPPIGFRKGGGYGQVVSTGVSDPLFCKAIVLQQGKTSAAMVISDLLSVPPDLSRKSRRVASRRTGIPFDNIIIAATHSHGSPEYWGSLRNVWHESAISKHGTDPHEAIDYQQHLVDSWAEAIAQAAANSQPALVELSVPKQSGLAFNRRFHMRNGTVRFNPGRGNPDIVRAAGPVDQDLPILLFRSKQESAEPIASLTTFAMHTAVAGGTEFSGDFPAVLQSRLRQKLGSDFISLFAEGAAGDINHINVHDTNALRGRPEVERIGNTLAATVAASIDSAKTLSETSLAVTSHTVHAPFKPVDEARFQEAMGQLRDQKTRRLPFLTLVEAWRDCHRYHHARLYGAFKAGSCSNERGRICLSSKMNCSTQRTGVPSCLQ